MKMSSTLSDFMGDSSFLSLINYIKTNESDKVETLYTMLIGLYGERAVAPIVTTFTAHTDAIADVIDMKYSEKWTVLKATMSGDIPTVSRTDTDTKTEHNKIYGYNDSDGVDDYEKTITTDKKIMFDDVFDAIENSIDIRDRLNYYLTIARDIASVLTTPVYESEDD